MGIFKRDNGLTEAKLRALICSAIEVMHIEGSNKGYKAVMGLGLSKNIKKGPGFSLALLDRLAKGQDESLISQEIFDHVIKKYQYEIIRGTFVPIGRQGLLALNLPSNTPRFWESLTNNANSNIDPFLSFLKGQDDGGAQLHNITLATLLKRIDYMVGEYLKTLRSLVVFGFSLDELAKIDNLCAWDYGRAGFVAKKALSDGHIDKDKAWGYMLAAGNDVYAKYASWKQFLAAFFIGRCMVIGVDDIADYSDTIRFLMKNRKSPYKKYPLRTS